MRRPSSILRISLLIALVVFVFNTSGLARPTPVEAAGTPVYDALNFIKNTLTSAASNILAGMGNPLTIKEYALDGVAHLVAQAAIRSIVHGVVYWANTGFNGSPSFVLNIGIHLGDIADQTASGFFSELSGFSLGSPFQSQVSYLLQQQYYESTAGNSFFLLNQCTTGDGLGVSIDGFDFNQGGLSGWYDFATQSQNNPYGLYFAAQDELSSRLRYSLSQTQDEIARNNGFLSWRGDCKKQGVAPQAVTATAPSFNKVNPDGTYDFTEGSVTTKDNGTNCLDYDIVTPGSVIESQLEQNLGSGISSLISADEINEVITAIAQGLISNVLGGGGLYGVSQPNYGGRDYFNQPDATSQDAAAAAGVTGNITAAINDKKAELTGYQSNVQTINTAALAAQTALRAAANSGHSCKFGEGPDAATVLQNVVNPVVDSSNKALTNAATSLSTLANIEKSVGDASDSTTAANAALNYQNFLSAKTTPSTSDIGNAQAQSQDLGAGQTSTTTPAGSTTIVTEMNNITREAQACTH